MAKAHHTWYLEPLSKEANARIGVLLSPEDFCDRVKCEDGKEHFLWKCTCKVALCFLRSDPKSYQIWGQEGNGKIRFKTFLFSKQNR